jgi:hypothetical protein
MALSASGLFVPSLINIFSNTIAVDLSSETNIKLGLLDNTGTPDFNTHDYWADLSAGAVTGTGWAASYTLTSTTLTASTGSLLFDAADVSASTTTLSNVYGAVVYDDSVTSPTDDPMICLIYFGGTAYNTTAGTFAITWSSSPQCIFQVDCTP